MKITLERAGLKERLIFGIYAGIRPKSLRNVLAAVGSAVGLYIAYRSFKQMDAELVQFNASMPAWWRESFGCGVCTTKGGVHSTPCSCACHNQ